MDVAFHASFLTEEGRRPGFRVALLRPDANLGGYELRKYFTNQPRKIVFHDDRPYSVGEINRLSPAVDMVRTIIGIRNRGTNHSPDLRIWGVVDVGDNWFRFLRHESTGGRNPPAALTVSSLSAGELSISIGGEVLATLRAGEISEPVSSPLWDGPVNDFLQASQRALYEAVVAELGTQRWDETGDDDDYPSRTLVHFLETVLHHIRERRHGGTLLMIPDHLSLSDTRITDRVIVKYPCDYAHVWELLQRHLVNHKRYFDLHFRLWEGDGRMRAGSFQENCLLETEKEEIQEALLDAAKAIAGLAGVDGAVLITDHLRVLGFGTEVIAASPTLSDVTLGCGQPEKSLPIEAFGTRHRSAFRFCSSFEDSVAFVVSQDGGVKAVKRVGPQIILWPDINAGAMGV